MSLRTKWIALHFTLCTHSVKNNSNNNDDDDDDMIHNFYPICSVFSSEGYYFEPKQAFDFNESGRKFEGA